MPHILYLFKPKEDLKPQNHQKSTTLGKIWNKPSATILSTVYQGSAFHGYPALPATPFICHL